MVSRVGSIVAYQDSNFLKLPKNILIHIFEKAISDIEDIPKLSLVCRDFKRLFKDDRIWQIIANKKGYNKISDFTWKESYHLHKTAVDRVKEIKIEETLVKIIIGPKLMLQKQEHFVMLILESLSMLYIQLNEIDKVKNFKLKPSSKLKVDIELFKTTKAFKKLSSEDVLEKTVPSFISRNNDLRALAISYFSIAYFQLNEIDKGRDLMDQIQIISSTRLVEDAQKELLSAYIRLNELNEAQTLIEQTLDPRMKDFARKKLIKAYLKLNKIDIAQNLFDKIFYPEMQILAKIEFIKHSIEFNRDEKAINLALVDEIADPEFVSSKVQQQFVKLYLQLNEIEKAKNHIDQIQEPNIKASAQIKLCRVYPIKNEINKTLDLIEQITQKSDDDFHQYLKAKVQVQLFKNFFRK